MNLFQLAAGRPAEIRGCATTVVRSYAGNTNCGRIGAEHLPDHLFRTPRLALDRRD